MGPHTCPSYRPLVEIKTCKLQGQENMSALICNRKWKMKRWAKKGNIKFINNKQWSSLTLTKVKKMWDLSKRWLTEAWTRELEWEVVKWSKSAYNLHVMPKRICWWGVRQCQRWTNSYLSGESHWWVYIRSEGCVTKYRKLGSLKQPGEKFILSQFWRLDVWNKVSAVWAFL